MSSVHWFSLPPNVNGPVWAQFRITLSSIVIQGKTDLHSLIARVRFWGCEEMQILSKNHDMDANGEVLTKIFEVRCDASSFSSYLLNSHYLYFDFCDMEKLCLIGFAIVDTTKDVTIPELGITINYTSKSILMDQMNEECDVSIYHCDDGLLIGQAHITMTVKPITN